MAQCLLWGEALSKQSPFKKFLQILPRTLSLLGGECLRKSSQNVLKSEFLCLLGCQRPSLLESLALKKTCPVREEQSSISLTYPYIMCLHATDTSPDLLPAQHALLTPFHPTPLSLPLPLIDALLSHHLLPVASIYPSRHRYLLKGGYWSCHLSVLPNLKRHQKEQ